MQACSHLGQLGAGWQHHYRSHASVITAIGSTARVGKGTRKQGSEVQVDTARLYTDASYQPKRQIGPIDVKIIKGKGRGVVATRDLNTGDLLMVSEPVGGIVTGAAGGVPADEVLVEMLERQALSPADRFRLSLLCDGTPASLQRPITLKDLSSEERAQTKGTKSGAPVRGFGAAAKQQQKQQQGSDLDGQRLAGIVALNAFGEELADAGVAACRGDPLDSYLGVWPEFALVNHSCAPNASHLLVGDRMLLRAAASIRQFNEITVSYMGGAAGVPVGQRRQMLQSVAGFECQCVRCMVESNAPEPIQQQLAAMHEWCNDTNAVNAAYAAEPGSTAAAELAAQARFLIEALEVELSKAQDMKADERTLLRASAYGLFQAMHVAADGGDAKPSASRSLELLMLTQVFMPGTMPALCLATEALERTSEQHGSDSKEAKDVLNLLMEAYVQHYGETPVEVFYQLLEARCKIPSYFGRFDAQVLLGQATPAAGMTAAAGALGGVPGTMDGVFAGARPAADSVSLFPSQAQQSGATAAQLQALLDSSRASD